MCLLCTIALMAWIQIVTFIPNAKPIYWCAHLDNLLKLCTTSSRYCCKMKYYFYLSRYWYRYYGVSDLDLRNTFIEIDWYVRRPNIQWHLAHVLGLNNVIKFSCQVEVLPSLQVKHNTVWNIENQFFLTTP